MLGVKNMTEETIFLLIEKSSRRLVDVITEHTDAKDIKMEMEEKHNIEYEIIPYNVRF